MQFRQHPLFVLSGILLSGLLSLGVFASTADASVVVVTQSSFGFVPRDITINVGDTVRWQWTSTAHTVTEGIDGTFDGNEAFRSPLSATVPTFQVTFDAAFLAAHPMPCNFYDYFCEVHWPGDMRGTITVGVPPGVGLCFGDGTTPTGCPCSAPDYVVSPTGAQGHGCANSLNFRGAYLCASGTVSPDTITFQASVAPAYNGFGFLVKGDAIDTNGFAVGDGLRCASGQLIRFGAHYAGTNGAPSGVWTYPNTAQTLSVTASTLQSAGQAAYYQLYYRNAELGFCSPGTSNFSNGYRLTWP